MQPFDAHPIRPLPAEPDSPSVRRVDRTPTSIAPARGLRVIEKDWAVSAGSPGSWLASAGKDMRQAAGTCHRASYKRSRHQPLSDGGAGLVTPCPGSGAPRPQSRWWPPIAAGCSGSPAVLEEFGPQQATPCWPPRRQPAPIALYDLGGGSAGQRCSGEQRRRQLAAEARLYL